MSKSFRTSERSIRIHIYVYVDVYIYAVYKVLANKYPKVLGRMNAVYIYGTQFTKVLANKCPKVKFESNQIKYIVLRQKYIHLIINETKVTLSS